MDEVMLDLVAGRNPEAPYCPLPWMLLLSSFFLLLCFAGVLLLLSQARAGQGLDSLGSSCAYKANTTQA